MPFQTPIPEEPQHGVGKFESRNAFDGLAGLRFAYQTTLGWLLPNIGVKLGQVPGKSGGTGGLDPAATAALFAAGTEAALGQIGKGLTATQSAKTDGDIAHAAALGAMAGQITQQARDTIHVKKHVNRRTTPQVITRYVKPNVKALVAPYVARTAVAEARARKAEADTAALKKRVAALERKAGRDSAVADPWFRPWATEWEKWRTGVEGKLKKIGKLAGIGAFLLLLAKALEKIGGNWIRCSGAKRYGKSLCGMNQNLLEGLIADALLVVSAVSLVAFAKELLTIEEEVVKGNTNRVKELKPGYKPVAGKLH